MRFARAIEHAFNVGSKSTLDFILGWPLEEGFATAQE
jgi:hypothetical protein